MRSTHRRLICRAAGRLAFAAVLAAAGKQNHHRADHAKTELDD